ncbi:MAG TPA: hypothetical protein VGB14_11155 [Acidimicrobiales bacterium]|jgi:hypothetical protein
MAPYYEDETPLGRYSARLRPAAVAPEVERRQRLVARAAQRVADRAFGADPAVSVEAADCRAVNIVDHHQVLNHPLLLGTNIISNASRLLAGDRRRPIVTFSCANVTPSNAYMRNGFRFRGRGVPYFSARESHDAMYLAAVRPFDFVERLQAMGRWVEFEPADRDFLVDHQAFLNHLDYSHCAGHRDQLAVVVRATWPLLFDCSVRAAVPDLLYLNAEEVTRDCLVELLSGDSFVGATLLEPGLRAQVVERFRGVTVAWDEAAGKGTHFFWRRYPGRPRLLRLYLDGDALVPSDARFRDLAVPMERNALLDHLAADEIVPSVALGVTVFLSAGIRPLVGPGSLVYITALRDGWTSLLTANGFGADAELVASVDTSGLIAGTPMFFERDGARLRALHAADVFAAGGVDREYLDAVLGAPLCDVLSVGAGGVYDLFAGTYIPPDRQLAYRIGFDDAATVVHRWV